MLRIAVQSKGRLFDDTMNLLNEADIKISASKRTLLVQASNFPLEVLYLRDDDIPQSVASGVADLGVVGENEFVERGELAEIISHLGFSKCRLSLAIPKDIQYPGVEWFNGKKIATSYPHILQQFLTWPNKPVLENVDEIKECLVYFANRVKQDMDSYTRYSLMHACNPQKYATTEDVMSLNVICPSCNDACIHIVGEDAPQFLSHHCSPFIVARAFIALPYSASVISSIQLLPYFSATSTPSFVAFSLRILT